MVTLTVCDGTAGGGADLHGDGAGVNDAPAFTSSPVTAATEGQLYSYGVTATDADAGDALTLAAPTKPAWLTFTDKATGRGR